MPTRNSSPVVGVVLKHHLTDAAQQRVGHSDGRVHVRHVNTDARPTDRVMPCRCPSCRSRLVNLSDRRLVPPVGIVYDTFRICVRRTKSWRAGRRRWHK
jgi:hypothetical protein